MYTDIDTFNYKIKDGAIIIDGLKKDEEINEINIAPKYNINNEELVVKKIRNVSIADSASKITIPSTVEFIGKKALDGPNLKEIVVDKDNKKYCTVNGILYNKKRTNLIKIPPCKVIDRFVLPHSVTSIREGAMKNCLFTTLVLNDKIKNLPIEMCLGCHNLNSVTFPDKLEEIGIRAFYNCPNLYIDKLPDTVTVIAAKAFAICKINNLELSDKIKVLGTKAFFGSIINSVTITGTRILSSQDDVFDASQIKLLICGNRKAFHMCMRDLDNVLFLNNLDEKEIMKWISEIVSIDMAKNIYFPYQEDDLNNRTEFKELEERKVYDGFFENHNTFADDVSILETKFDYSQINQIIKGYNNNIYLNNLSPEITTDDMRLFNKAAKKDLAATTLLISELQNCNKLDKMDMYIKLNNINKEIELKVSERGDR